MLPPLDPVLHSHLRLAIVSLLVQYHEIDFKLLQQKTQATAGNLSAQLAKLKGAGYVEVQKLFRDNYPLTLCKLLPEGEHAFRNYASAISSYTHPRKQA